MKSFIFLILGIGLCLAAVISFAGLIGIAGITSGSSVREILESYQVMIGIIAAAFLICGSFFLYKAYTESKKS